MMRSQSGAACNFAFNSSERAAMSRRTMRRFFFDEGIARNRSVNLIASQNFKAESKFLRQFVLPLFKQDFLVRRSGSAQDHRGLGVP